MEPGKSKDDILFATAHDIEEMPLSNLFKDHIKGTNIVDCTSLVYSLVYIPNCNRETKFFHRELVFSDKIPVNTGDIGTRVNQCERVDNF